MKLHRRWGGLLVVVVALGLAGVVLAQVSANFDLHWSLLSGGGGSRASVNYQVGDTLGQWADGSSSSSNYRVTAGFWSGILPISAPQKILFLPLVTKN